MGFLSIWLAGDQPEMPSLSSIFAKSAPNRFESRPFPRILHQESRVVRCYHALVGEILADEERGEDIMEFEAERSRTAQILSLLLTLAVVGGALAWAMSAA
jgi:hypothetical protein